jgi:hypothetical protein
VHDSFEQCISDGGVADLLVPVLDWELAGDDG